MLTGVKIFNLQRLAVLTTALTRSPPDADLIFQAMQDKVHQPYRKGLVSSLGSLSSRTTVPSNPNKATVRSLDSPTYSPPSPQNPTQVSLGSVSQELAPLSSR